MIDYAKHVQCLEDLGGLGVVVSIKYGPLGNGQVSYSVDAWCTEQGRFESPYLAESFGHAVFIAAEQSLKRGWI